MSLNDEINSLCLKLEERNLFILETIVIQIKNMLCFLKIEDLYSRVINLFKLISRETVR